MYSGTTLHVGSTLDDALHDDINDSCGSPWAQIQVCSGSIIFHSTLEVTAYFTRHANAKALLALS